MNEHCDICQTLLLDTATHGPEYFHMPITGGMLTFDIIRDSVREEAYLCDDCDEAMRAALLRRIIVGMKDRRTA